MATIYQMKETSLPEIYSSGLYNQKGWDLRQDAAMDMAEVFIVGTSNLLREAENKEYPVAVVFEEPNGEFSVAAIVRFILPEDEKMPGHWDYAWTFYKEDIPDNARIRKISEVDTHVYYRAVAGQKFSFGFESPASLSDCGNFFFKCLSQFLTDNAKEGEEITLNLEGVFQARAAVENEEVVKSLEITGEIKAIVKNDAGQEV